MAAQIECGELYIANGKLFGCGMESRLEDSDTIILQHVQQGCLSGVIETEEQEFGMFVEQTQGRESIPEPVDNPHLGNKGRWSSESVFVYARCCGWCDASIEKYDQVPFSMVVESQPCQGVR